VVFVRNVIGVAIVTGHLELFYKFILTQDGDLKVTRPLFDSLIDFLSARGMDHCLVSVYGMMNCHEYAADGGLRLYATAPDLQYRIYYLGCAAVCLTQAIRVRQGIGPLHPPPRETSSTLEDLLRRSAIVDLQQRLTKMCYQRDLPFSADLDFVTNPAAFVRGAAFFLLHDDKRSFADLGRCASLSPDRILDAAIAMSACLTPDHVTRFITKYLDNHPGGRDRLICRILAGLALTRHWQVIALIVGQLGGDDRRQCGLFCEFDWLFEALNVAEISGLTDLVPLIAHRASDLGIEMVQRECERVLNARPRK
jgi:hypothetical protein